MDSLSFDDLIPQQDAADTAQPEPSLSFDDLVPQTPPANQPRRRFEERQKRDEEIGSTIGAIGEDISSLWNSWGNLTPEEAEAEKKDRLERARQQELWAQQQRADIESRMGKDFIPGQTLQESAAAEARDIAEGPAPTKTVAKSAAEGFLRETGQGIVSLGTAPGIAVDFIDWAATGDTNESGYTKALRGYSTSIENALPGDPTRRGELLDQLAGGGGSMTSMLVGGAALRIAGLPLKAGQYYAGITQGGVSGYEDAEAKDATPGQKYASFFLNAGLGATDAIPISRAFDRLNDASGGKVQQILANSTANSLEEFVQELGQGLGANFIANTLAGYDVDRSTTEGVMEQAAVGFILGGIMGGGTTAIAQTARRPEEVSDKGASQEESAALKNAPPMPPVAGATSAPAATVAPDQAQAIAGAPVETPRERALRIARERDQRAAAQAAAQAARTAPTAPAAQPAPVSQPAAPPTATAGTEPSATVGVKPTAPPPAAPAPAPAPAAPVQAEAPPAAPNEEITANVPTASTEEVPPSRANFYADSPETIKLQHEALRDPKNDRKVVVYSADTSIKDLPDKPQGKFIVRRTFKIDGVSTIVDFNTAKTNYGEVQKAIRTGKLNELLDLGPYNQQQVAESASAGAAPVAVTERTPDGTEVKTAAGTTETAPEQVQALEETKSAPENTVQVEDPRQVAAERQATPKRKITPIKQPGEGYRIGQFSFDFNERGGARYVRVRDRSGRNLLQSKDGGAPEVDVTDIWSVADPNQVEKRQGSKVGINSLSNNVPTELVPVFRDYLEGKIDSDEALARISNTDVGGSTPAAKTPAPKAEQAKATSKAREEKAEAAPPKPRVLQDLSPESQKAKQEQAEQNEVIADQIKPFLKGRGKIKTLKEADEKTGKSWTPAERIARRRLNVESEQVADRFAPTPAVDRVERDFLDANASKRANARAAIRARAEAMLAAAEEAGLSLPEKVSENTDTSMNLGRGPVNLIVARDFLKALQNPYKDIEDHYTDFLSRDMRLRKGLLDEVVSERRTEIDDKMRGGQGGNIEQIAANSVGDTAAEADTELSAETPDVANPKIVGKDDIEARKPTSARMAPKIDDATEKGELTVKSGKDGKTKKIVADVAKPASEGRVYTEEEKKAWAKLAGVLKRESGDSGPAARDLNDSDVLQEVTLADAIAEAGEAKGNAVNRSIVNRLLARIARNIGDTPVKVVDQATLDEMFPDRPAGRVDGFYDPQKDHIIVSANFLKGAEFDARLLAHEGLHAYLQRAVDSDATLQADIQQILDYARGRAPAAQKDSYGFKDVHEFLSEAMSNPDFQNLLMAIRLPDALASKYDAPTGSLWQGLVSAVRKHLKLGNKDVDALSYAMRLVERAEDRRGKTGEADLVRGMRERGLLSQGRQRDDVTSILKWLGKKPVADPQTQALFSGTPEKFRKDAQSWNTAGEAADWLIANSRDEATREIINKIRPAIENSLFSVVKAGDTVPAAIARNLNSGAMGVYWSKFDTNERALYVRDEFLTEEVVAHELLHAATNTRLKEGNLVKNKDTELAKVTAEFYDLQRVVMSRYNQLVRGKVNPEITQNLQVLSSVSSVEELATYGLTNAKVREFFKSIPYRGGNVFTEFVDKIRRLFNIPRQDTNALTKIIELTERLVGTEFSQDTRPYASDFLRDINTVGGSITPAMRDYAQELKDAGVPDDVAAELDAFINEELGNAIDPATLPLFMGDLIKEYGSPASGGAAPPTPPASTPAPAGPKPKGKATRRRGLAIKLNTLDYLRQKYNPYFDNLIDPYVKEIQKRENTVSEVSDKHDKVAAEFLDLMRRDRQEAVQLANIAMEATRFDVRVGPNADNSHLGKEAKRGLQGKKRLSNLNARFANLKPPTQELYRRMTESYRETHNNNIRALAYNVLTSLDTKLSNSDLMMLMEKVVDGTLTEADAQLIGDPDLFTELRGATSLKTIKGDYFPQMRFGDFVVLTTDTIVDPGITSVTLKGKAGTQVPVKTSVDKNVVRFQIDPTVRGAQTALDRAVNKYIEENDLTLLRASKRFIDKQSGQIVSKGEQATDRDYDVVVEVELQNQGVNFFDSRKDAEKFRKEVGADKISEVLDRREDFTDRLISGSALTAVTKRIEARTDIPEYQRKQMRQAVQQAIISQMPGNRAQSRYIARRNVKGASTDIARAAVTYGQAAGNYYATLVHAPEIRKAFNKLSEFESKNQMNEGAGVRAQVMNELRARQETMDDPLYLNKFIQNVAALSFFDKLVSPAYSIINFQQAIGNGLPYLGGQYGNTRAALAISSAYRKIGTLGTIASGLKNTAVAVGQLRRSAIDTTDLIGSIRKNLGPKYDALLDEMIARGLVSPNSGFEIGQAIIDGSGAFNTGIAKFDRIARQLPNAVEAVNRTVVAVAAFDLATSRGKSIPDAIQEAYNAAANTQGDYRTSNNPRFMRNRWLSWALQFKKYAVLQTQLVGDMYVRAFKGATKQERAIARKQLATMIAVQTLYAGALGLPGLELAKLGFALAAMLGVGDGWDDFEEDIKKLLDESIGQTWSELLRKGVLTRAIGIDVSQRMSQADLWTGFMPDTLDRDGMMQYAGSLLLGAPGSTLFDWFDAARDLGEGNIQKALEKLIPIKAVADTMRAVDQVQRGKMTVGEAIAKSIGFQPARMANIGDEIGAEIRENKKISQERSKIYKDYINATSEGELAKIKARVREFNAKQGKNGRKISIKSLERARKRELERYSD